MRLDRRTERLLDLLGDVEALRVTLGPPRFRIPDDAAAELELPICDGCRSGIDPRTHGCVRWGDRDLHVTCAHDELLALRTAA